MSTAQLEDYYADNFNNLVKRITNQAGNVHNAEDVVQEAFVRAIQYLPSYDGKLPFENWFSRILQNALRQFKLEERNYGMNMSNEEVDIPCPICLENKRLVHDVKNYIRANIPKDEQEILILYYIRGYSFQDIVRITDEKYRRVNYVVYKFNDTIQKLGEEIVT
jgi:RNA polymerase sigma factor (sigma-70 family)